MYITDTVLHFVRLLHVQKVDNVQDCKLKAKSEMAEGDVMYVSLCKPSYLSTDILNVRVTLAVSSR